MKLMTHTQSPAAAGLTALIILQIVMLLALFFQTAPHPPLTVPPFAIGPFIGASLAIAAAAMMLGATDTKAGAALSLLAVACAMVSFGPQKYFDAQFSLIWPAVLTGQAASVVILVSAIHRLRHGDVNQASRAYI